MRLKNVSERPIRRPLRVEITGFSEFPGDDAADNPRIVNADNGSEAAGRLAGQPRPRIGITRPRIMVKLAAMAARP